MNRGTAQAGTFEVCVQSCKKCSTFLRAKFPKFSNLPQNVVKSGFPTEEQNESLFFQKEGMIAGIDHQFFLLC